MKRAIRVVSQALVVLLLVSSPALAWNRYGWRYYHGGWRYYYGPRVVVGVGPWWGPPWGYYPVPYPGAYPPPVVVTQPAPAPPVYVERDDAPPAAMDEPSTPGPQDAGAYWYYCPGAREYYPKVPTCAEQWVKVPASAE